jgi:hypothetical protein
LQCGYNKLLGEYEVNQKLRAAEDLAERVQEFFSGRTNYKENLAKAWLDYKGTSLWQPIGTWHKPKHEDFAMVYGKLIDDPEIESPIVQEAMWDGKTWRCLFLGAIQPELTATHWMPLPPKPDSDSDIWKDGIDQGDNHDGNE